MYYLTLRSVFTMRSVFKQVVPITKNVRLSVRIVHTYKLFVRSDLLSNPALSVYAGSRSNELCFEKINDQILLIFR